MTDPRQDHWRLQVHESVASTSDLCRALAADGEPEGLAVLARRQSQARGSRGRDWSSPEGNLSLSVLLRPREPAHEAGQWSLLAAVAVADALVQFLPDAGVLRLKWPNDVLLNGAKLAGILVDAAAGPEGVLDWLVIGIGVNLAVAPDVPRRRVACLADIVPPPTPEAFAVPLLDRLHHWRLVRARHGFGPIRAAWLERAPATGSEVTLRIGERRVIGGFAGLGDDGTLLLDADGRVRAFAAGEVLL